MSKFETVFSYHERTKHHVERYARSLGYMDWETQPNPFRRYQGAPVHRLDVIEGGGPSYDGLFDREGEGVAGGSLSRQSISALLFDSVALSAWKEAGRSRWPLRVNPSSGNLHPTEVYLIAGPIVGLNEQPAVYHYAVQEHALEERTRFDLRIWKDLSKSGEALFVGLSSIVWREAWKYGERSFRYCQHDVGHAIGALCVASAMQGRRCWVVDSVGDDELAALLGIAHDRGPEREHPDVLLAVAPEQVEHGPQSLGFELGPWAGQRNRLSADHHNWPILDEISQACAKDPAAPSVQIKFDSSLKPSEMPCYPERGLMARQLVRARRSAVKMDGETSVSQEAFFRLISRLVPRNCVLGALRWSPQVHVVFFVHDVVGLEPGLYVLVRNEKHKTLLQKDLDPQFLWQQPEACPSSLALYLLMPSDVRGLARTVSCHQDIASDGAFCVSMLARFRPAIEQWGPSFYRRLFWETGVIGQLLYLEAEAAGLRGTGIGCFFDDAVHQLLGLENDSFQSLYHFTVGGPVDDPRIQTLAAYDHLK